MARYIDADKFVENIQENICRKCDIHNGIKCKSCEIDDMFDFLEDTPTADVVLTAVMEQIKWERDIAIEQLESYGVCLGENKELAEVKHGEWVHTDKARHWSGKDECSVCTYHTFDRDDLSQLNYCPNCGAKMDGRGDT